MRTINIQIMDDFEKELYDFKILFAYHSGKIENENITYHNTRDIFESGRVVAYTGDLKTLYEIENQKQCYEFLKPYILEKKDMDIEFIKKVHYKLTKGTYDEYRYNVNQERPGEFKKHDYVTGIHEVGSMPEDVEQDLSDLLEEINDKDFHDYYLGGIYFHAVFENIHPFADGNGRVGRTLMNYYFMTHDIAPVIIYNEDKNEYYKVLEEFDTKEEIKPLYQFIAQQQEKTWEKKEVNRTKSLSSFQMESEQEIEEDLDEKRKIETELKRISELTGFSVSKITECILSHSLFPESMKSDIWEVISKHLARNKTTT